MSKKHAKVCTTLIYIKHFRISRCISMAYKFFDEKRSGGAATLANKYAVLNENMSNKELSEELHKPIIRKLNKRKVHSSFVDNSLGADVACPQLISKFNEAVYFHYVLLILLVNTHG